MTGTGVSEQNKAELKHGREMVMVLGMAAEAWQGASASPDLVAVFFSSSFEFQANSLFGHPSIPICRMELGTGGYQ
jgi:hypothetical protein